MVYEYVAVRTSEDNEEIISDGKVIASSENDALIKIGKILGEKYDDDVSVQIRPF